MTQKRIEDWLTSIFASNPDRLVVSQVRGRRGSTIRGGTIPVELGPEADPAALAAELAEAIVMKCQAHADAWTGRQSYSVTAYAGDLALGKRALSLRARDDDQEEEEDGDGDDLDPTARGLVLQAQRHAAAAQRHAEAMARTMVQGFDTTMREMRNVLHEVVTRANTLETQKGEIELAALELSRERGQLTQDRAELEVLLEKEVKDTELRERLLGLLEQGLPVAALALQSRAGGPGGPGPKNGAGS